MAFNVNDFRGKLQNGGARPNMFEVIISNPAGAAAALDTEELAFMCKATSLPASTVGSIDVPYFGRTIKVAGDREFDQWSITVINDESFDLRNAFERWSTAMASYSTAVNAQRNLGASSNPYSYAATGVVNQYGKEGNIIKTVSLINLWPVSVSEISLGWDQNNAIEEFTVTWAYDYFVSDSAI